uniref:Uncharacterized protein n=1 Tax=Arundo donax TaxID=35708 RepID=A0A0A9E0L5_ARUDO
MISINIPQIIIAPFRICYSVYYKAYWNFLRKKFFYKCLSSEIIKTIYLHTKREVFIFLLINQGYICLINPRNLLENQLKLITADSFMCIQLRRLNALHPVKANI